MADKLVIGALEICDLPDLGISNMTLRVDTGAKTSSLHVDGINTDTRNGRPWVSFDLHPDIHDVEHIVRCSAPVADIRRVKSSNGDAEQRYVIRTLISMAGLSWPIEITLSNRSDMTYLMLMGRQAMAGKVLIDPSAEFLAGGLDPDSTPTPGDR